MSPKVARICSIPCGETIETLPPAPGLWAMYVLLIVEIQRFSRKSTCGPAAIDENGVSSNQGRCIGRKKNHGPGYLHWFANPMQCGDALDGIGAIFRHRKIFLRPGRVNKRG